MAGVLIKTDETVDDLLINDLKLIQKGKGFRFTLDAVLLAHFATVKKGDKVVDLGTGTGIIPLIVSTRAEELSITGIEIQQDIAEMASRSIVLNSLEDVITIQHGDIRNLHKTIGGGIFTLVTANPPYWTVKEGQPSSLASRAISRHELSCSLEDVVACASKLLNYQGRFALIYRSERFKEVLSLLNDYALEPRMIRFIHPYQDRPARHFLLEARKNAPADLKVMAPLIVYEKQGRYSAEILKWYGKGEVPIGQ